MRLPALLCLWFAFATSARANDTAMGGQGANLVPLKTSDIFMASEDITLTLRGVEGDPAITDGETRARETWQVDARYVFENPADEAITLQLGFPEYRCETLDPEAKDFCPSDRLFHFEAMQTLVRGEAVPQRKGKLHKRHRWAPLLGDVWLYDVRFAPGERVPITHRYAVPTTLDSSGGRAAHYVTRTGAMWARPITHARFTFRYPARICSLIEPEGIRRVSYRIAQEGTELVAEAVYESDDWTPTGDLTFYAQLCAPPRDFFERGRQAQCKLHAELSTFAYASTSKPTDRTTDTLRARLQGLSVQELRACRSYPFAAYGRRFEDAQLNELFYGVPAPDLSTGPLVPFTASSHYTDKLLTPQDERWVRVVDEALSMRAAPSPPSNPQSKDDHNSVAPSESAKQGAPPRHRARSSCAGCTVSSGGVRSPWMWLAVLLFTLVSRRARGRKSRSS